MTGIVVLLSAVLAAAGFALHRRRVDGRFVPVAPVEEVASTPLVEEVASTPLVEEVAQRTPLVEEVAQRPSRDPVPPSTGDLVLTAVPEAELGERATLVQFSSAFCAPCRTTRVVLADIATSHEGVRHLDIDAEEHLDLVRALDVRRTPTTLVLGPDGHELVRAAGAPRKEQVLSALPAPQVAAVAHRTPLVEEVAQRPSRDQFPPLVEEVAQRPSRDQFSPQVEEVAQRPSRDQVTR